MELTPERQSKFLSVLGKRQADITVVLENVDDPHNIAAVLRTCDAVGIQDVFVLTTRIHPHKKFSPRASSSAAKWLTVHPFTNTFDCVAELRKRYRTILTTHLSADAVNMHEIDFTQSIALVFGNEHDGVSEEIRSLADGNFIIPQVGIIQSLNISVACAVTVYEAMRQRTAAGQFDSPSLPPERRADLLEQWSISRAYERAREKGRLGS